jgi:glycosyltransferase involved in cell wall biosynthesis/SAM-dependent methyltransferase
MRLAYFSPLPPSKSGIADYSAELLPLLSLGAEISVFVEDEEQLRQESADYAVFRAVDFPRLREEGRFDLSIYHQGNNPYHEYIYDRALADPGLVVLHEHCLHHLIAWTTLGRRDEDAYWTEVFHAYGRRGAELAEMRERDIGSEYQQFVLPLNRRLISRSLGLIVHNQFAASHLEGADRIPMEIIPHHLSPRVFEYDDLDVLECRRSLGISDETLVIGSFGFVTQSKRIPVLLAVFKRLLELRPNMKCIIVGEDHWKWSVAPVIAEMGLGAHVEITGYADEEQFFRYMKAVDIVVNLRYPTAGETSGTLIRSLGMGKAVVVSDHGQFGELPDDTCLKVSPGAQEEHDLYLRLRALIYRPALRQRIADRAKAFARQTCDIERCAARYLAFAEHIIREQRDHRPARPLLPLLDLKYEEPPLIELDSEAALAYLRGFFDGDEDAISYLNIHGQRIIRTVNLLPRGNGEGRLLELSSYLQMTPLILRDGGYREVTVTNWWEGEPRVKTQAIRHSGTGVELSFPMFNVDVERDRFPFDDLTFDVVLCCELIEHLTEDPLHMLLEANRVLKWGGILVVTTPNIASAFSIKEAMSGSSPYIYGSYNVKSRADRHSREYTPSDVRLVLESAGFKIVKLFSEDLWHETDESFLKWLDHTGVPRTLRGDNIFAVGRKLSDQVDRYPDLIYD